MKSLGFLLVLLPALLTPLASAETAEPRQTRIAHLEHAVLAPCCYTESVALHQSEIAVKMRLEIVKWVETGKSDREILDTYVRLYGSKVLVDSRTIPGWWTPWVPWIALTMGAVWLTWFLKRWRAKVETRQSSSWTKVAFLKSTTNALPLIVDSAVRQHCSASYNISGVTDPSSASRNSVALS